MSIASKCFVKRDDFVTRNIAGETIVVPVRGQVGDLDSIYTVNEVGTLIWQLIDGDRSVDQIAEAVVETYQVAPEDAQQDVADFVRSLEEEGLVELVAADKE